MRRLLFFVCVCLIWSGLKAESPDLHNSTFEEAYARNIEPQAKIFVAPQTCDLQYLSDKRVEFGPYQFKFKGDLTESMLESFKNRALYVACVNQDADMMIGALYDSWIDEKQSNILNVTFLAYPVKFINFRNLEPTEKNYEMIKAVYPSSQDPIGKIIDRQVNIGK